MASIEDTGSAVVIDESASRRRGLIQLSLISALILLIAQLPFLVQYCSNLWRFRPHYEFFPVVLLTFAYLCWNRWPADADGTDRMRWLEFALFGSAFLVTAASVALFSPWLAAIAGVLVTGGIMVNLGGRRAFSELWAVWALLWLIILPPFRFDLTLIESMQSFTSRASSKILDFLDIIHLRAGNVIELPGRQLFVAEACSGVKSQLVLVAVTAILVVLWHRPIRHSILLIGIAFFWATLVNIVRVATVAIAAASWDMDLSEGWRHEVLGLGLVGIGLLLVMSTDQFMAMLLAPIVSSSGNATSTSRNGRGTTKKGSVNPFVRFWNRFLAYEVAEHSIEYNMDIDEDDDDAIEEDSDDDDEEEDSDDDDEEEDAEESDTDVAPVAERESAGVLRTFKGYSTSLFAKLVLLLFCVLGVLELIILANVGREGLDIDQVDVAFDESSLPQDLSGWQRLEYATEHRDRSSDEGECSQIWRYRAGSVLAQVSLDYPFVGWHELTQCYEGRGWHIDERRVRDDESMAAIGGKIVEVDLSMPGGENGYLLFSLFDGQGRPVTPDDTNWKGWRGKIAANPLFLAFGGQGEIAAPETIGMQVQQFMVTETRFTPEERDNLVAKFVEARTHLRDRWLEQRGE
jgi:exosortase